MCDPYEKLFTFEREGRRAIGTLAVYFHAELRTGVLSFIMGSYVI